MAMANSQRCGCRTLSWMYDGCCAGKFEHLSVDTEKNATVHRQRVVIPRLLGTQECSTCSTMTAQLE